MLKEHPNQCSITGYLFGICSLISSSDLPIQSDRFECSPEVLSITCLNLYNVIEIYSNYHIMTWYLFDAKSLTPSSNVPTLSDKFEFSLVVLPIILAGLRNVMGIHKSIIQPPTIYLKPVFRTPPLTWCYISLVPSL